MDYYKSVRDENADNSISGLSKWLFRQQILMEKSKSSIADSMEPKRVSKSLTAAVSWDSREAPSYARDIPKCSLHPKNSSHYLKNCNKFKALTLKEKYEVMKALSCHLSQSPW